MTYKHHDAKGAMSWAGNMFGKKSWIHIFCKEQPIQEELAKFLEWLTNPRNLLQKSIDHVEAVVLHIHLRDFLSAMLSPLFFPCLLMLNQSIMSLDQIHCMFIPVGSFCQERHFYNLFFMCLMSCQMKRIPSSSR